MPTKPLMAPFQRRCGKLSMIIGGLHPLVFSEQYRENCTSYTLNASSGKMLVLPTRDLQGSVLSGKAPGTSASNVQLQITISRYLWMQSGVSVMLW